MTRSEDPTGKSWRLQDAKARFSEVVHLAQSDVKHVTLHGREAVVVVSARAFRKLTGHSRTGADPIAAMQACPYPEEDILPPSVFMPVSDPVDLE